MGLRQMPSVITTMLLLAVIVSVMFIRQGDEASVVTLYVERAQTYLVCVHLLSQSVHHCL